MIDLIALTLGAMIGTGTGLIAYTAIANRARTIGGLTFIRFGRTQISLCRVRNAT